MTERERFSKWWNDKWPHSPLSWNGDYPYCELPEIDPRGDWEAWQVAWQASAREQMALVLSEIESSTGPTGGWLDSPKALAAAIAESFEREAGK